MIPNYRVYYDAKENLKCETIINYAYFIYSIMCILKDIQQLSIKQKDSSKHLPYWDADLLVLLQALCFRFIIAATAGMQGYIWTVGVNAHTWARHIW